MAVARGSLLHSVSAPVVDTEYDPNPQYSYAYDVQDPFTGDSKSQVETRNGDVVKGQYSLLDSDGTKRTVDYSADPINGFNAVVSKTPIVAPVAARIEAAPVVSNVVAAPVVAKTIENPVVSRLVSSPALANLVSSPVVAKTVSPANLVSNVVSSPVLAQVSTPVVSSRVVSPLSYASLNGYNPSVYSAHLSAPIVSRISSPYAYTTNVAASYPYSASLGRVSSPVYAAPLSYNSRLAYSPFVKAYY